MAKGGEGREGNALKTALVVAGGLALAWVTVETAFRPFLDRLRAAVSRSTDPSRDSDQEEDSTPAPAAPSAPPAAAEEVEEKAPAPTSSEPSAPPVPVEDGDRVADKVAESEEKAEDAAAKAE